MRAVFKQIANVILLTLAFYFSFQALHAKEQHAYSEPEFDELLISKVCPVSQSDNPLGILAFSASGIWSRYTLNPCGCSG